MAIEEYIEGNNIPHIPMVIDESDEASALATKYDVYSVPTIIQVNDGGEITVLTFDELKKQNV